MRIWQYSYKKGTYKVLEIDSYNTIICNFYKQKVVFTNSINHKNWNNVSFDLANINP
jgi:hypothetical protein